MKTVKLEDISSLSKKDFKDTIKVIPTKILEQLQQIELPIKNREIAIINICDFLIYLNTQFDKFDTSLLVIPQNIFIKYFNSNKESKYKEILKQLNILTQVSYANGSGYDKDNGIAKQYRIHNDYLNQKEFSLLILENKLHIKLYNIETEMNDVMLDTILIEELDYEQVFLKEIAYHKLNETTNFSLFIRLSRALLITKERYAKKGKKVNRIFHSFSNLSKVTRKCFKTKYNNIDLVNSQPMLLVAYLMKNKIEFEKKYQTICEDGKFYELFYDLYCNDISKLDKNELEQLRKLVKTKCYESLFFDFRENFKINKRFNELFPILWLHLKEIDKSNISLASILQNIEADIFNNLTIKYSTKMFTMFDAIYFNNKKDLLNLSNQIIKYGKQINVNFKIKIELNENNTNTLELLEETKYFQ